MNREIIFRGKRTDNGEWVYGKNIQFQIDGTNNVCISKEGYQRWLNPETVGQYTGLKDCYGNHIFEGDIFDIGGLLKGVITWHQDGYWCIADKDGPEHKGLFKVSYIPLGEMIDRAKDRAYPYNVVGNIFDDK